MRMEKAKNLPGNLARLTNNVDTAGLKVKLFQMVAQGQLNKTNNFFVQVKNHLSQHWINMAIEGEQLY